MDDNLGVTESESPAGTPSPASDRPIQNVVGEFNRKFGALEQKLDQLTSVLAQQQSPQPEAPKGGLHSLSDDELWDRAKTGDKSAFDLHQARQADRVYSARRAGEESEALVDRQINALFGKYPVLANPQHPLTQTTNMAYTLLTRRGYPANKATLLEAAKTAIADRPDIISDLHTQGRRAGESARRSAVGNPGVTGASHRQDDPSTIERVRVSPQEAVLAKRMNIADPSAAKARFLQRQRDGRSSFGGVASYLNEGEF